MKISNRAFATAFIACLIIIGCSSDNQIPNLENPEWYLRNNPAPSSTTISLLTDSLIPRYNQYTREFFNQNPQGYWQIDTIGQLNGHTAIDLFYVLQRRRQEDTTQIYIRHAFKAIAIETSMNKYRLLYLPPGSYDDFSFKPSRLARISGIQVLYTSSLQTGTGHYSDNVEWIWDTRRNIPFEPRLPVNQIGINSELIPPGHGIWKGGGFDLERLFYKSYTWRDGDGNCCPTGGSITINYELTNRGFFIKKAVFDYGDVEPRARWLMERSADSSYLSLKPRIYEAPSKIDTGFHSDWLTFDALEKEFSNASVATTIDTIVNFKARGMMSGFIYENAAKTRFTWLVDSIGRIGGHQFVEVSFTIECLSCAFRSGRVVAVETEPDLYRTIYMEATVEIDSGIPRHALLVSDSDTLLMVKGMQNRSGRYKYNYWLWSKEINAPVNLYQQWVLDETLSLLAPRVLPKGFSPRPQKGKWDYMNLSYETYTWKESDPDWKPSGGKLKIQFHVKDKRLVPVDYSFSPSDTIVPD